VEEAVGAVSAAAAISAAAARAATGNYIYQICSMINGK
jgi:hypothetical protein